MDLIKRLNNICSIDQKLSGVSYLQELGKNMASEMDVKYALIGRPAKDQDMVIQTDVAIADGQVLDNFSYELKGTPCLNVFSGKRVCIHEKGVAQLFPDDLLLEQMGVEGYIGAPILDHEGGLLGLVILLDSKELTELPTLETVCEFIAGRISGEFYRMESENRLLSINTELENIIDERTGELEKLTEQLRKDNVSLEKALETNNKLMATIFHDISNPLSIASFEAVKLGKMKVEGLEKTFSNLDYSIDQVVKIINNVKSVFSGSNNEQLKSLNLKDVVNYARFIFDMKLSSKEIQIVSKNLDCSISVSETVFLNSVFNNFISNSIKFSNIGGKITIDSRIEGDRVFLTIQDEGEGFPASVIDSLVNNEKISSTPGTAGEVGTGLGLGLTKSYLSQMGGSFSITNNETGALVELNLKKG
jgi:signal transduction histidine kinase